MCVVRGEAHGKELEIRAAWSRNVGAQEVPASTPGHLQCLKPLSELGTQILGFRVLWPQGGALLLGRKALAWASTL